MTTYTGDSKVGFGFLGFLSHLFIALGVIAVIIALPIYLISHGLGSELAETMGLVILGGGAGVAGGIGLGFLNILFS